MDQIEDGLKQMKTDRVGDFDTAGDLRQSLLMSRSRIALSLNMPSVRWA
jgi:hypothetical protein